jgi:hypothetical protein
MTKRAIILAVIAALITIPAAAAEQTRIYDRDGKA